MFIDETVIEVHAGDGGNGCFAYAREKFKPRGKPNGGCGGRGGHIYVQVTSQLHTLQDVSYHRSYKAERGAHGKGSNKDGRSGVDITIKLPIGTVIFDDTTKELIHDCVKDGEIICVAQGGRGGRGNGVMVSNTNRNPDHSEPGKPGDQKILRLQLKVLADIGLVGRPNAGKSTFLSVISKAHPKIADYPFTTKEPHLGIVRFPKSDSSCVVADIPGLIEGSNEGKGLGIRFLRHIERTRVLAILVESTHEDPLREADILLHELESFSPLLLEKPRCFIMTKKDLVYEEELKVPQGWYCISSHQHQGLDDVLLEFFRLLDSQKNDEERNTDPNPTPDMYPL